MFASLGGVGRVGRMGLSGRAALVGRPSLTLDFMQPGSLDSRITFSRTSPATYTDANITIQTAAVNAPRWDYDPFTHAMRGLLIEEARTNLWLQSADAGNAAWSKAGNVVTAPVVTPNQTIAPDGTLTAAGVVFPAVSGTNALSLMQQNLGASAVPYTFSVWMRGSVGGEQIYINVNGAVYYTSPRITLTTQWTRYVITTPALTASGWWFVIGTDLRDSGQQAATPAQTIFVWGAQAELGAFPTSYIPTTSGAVARAVDLPSLGIGAWYTSPGGSWMAEVIRFNSNVEYYHLVQTAFSSGVFQLAVRNDGAVAQYDGATLVGVETSGVGVVVKCAASWATGSAKVCLNGGVVTTSAGLVTGYATAGPLALIQTSVPTQSMTGYVRRIQYWPRALSDAEMQAVTT